VDEISALTERQNAYLFLHTDHYTFSTCHQLKGNKLSLSHFIQPLDPITWYLLQLSGALVVLLVTFITARMNLKPPRIREIILKTFFSILGEVLENQPPMENSLQQYSSLRFALVTWSLGILVLGQGYKGTITSTTVVASIKPQLDSFKDAMVRNLSVYSSASRTIIEMVDMKRAYSPNYSLPTNLLYFDFFRRVQNDMARQTRLAKQNNHLPMQSFKLLQQLWKNRNLKINISAKNYIPREAIENCKNSIFVDRSDSIRNLFYLHPTVKRSHKLYIGKERIMPVLNYAMLIGIPSELMMMRLKSTVHSGISDRIVNTLKEISSRSLKREYLKYNNEISLANLQTDTEEEVDFLTMESTMMQIFYVCAIVLLLALTVFFVEMFVTRICDSCIMRRSVTHLNGHNEQHQTVIAW
jgi:hypothetical protein